MKRYRADGTGATPPCRRRTATAARSRFEPRVPRPSKARALRSALCEVCRRLGHGRLSSHAPLIRCRRSAPVNHYSVTIEWASALAGSAPDHSSPLGGRPSRAATAPATSSLPSISASTQSAIGMSARRARRFDQRQGGECALGEPPCLRVGGALARPSEKPKAKLRNWADAQVSARSPSPRVPSASGYGRRRRRRTVGSKPRSGNSHLALPALRGLSEVLRPARGSPRRAGRTSTRRPRPLASRMARHVTDRDPHPPQRGARPRKLGVE